MNDNLVDCPACEGVGTFLNDGTPETGPYNLRCNTCDCTGKVTAIHREELLQRYAEEEEAAEAFFAQW